MASKLDSDIATSCLAKSVERGQLQLSSSIESEAKKGNN